ncbi:helix-turn-helix transcriptional regulator [Deinococcus aquaedulcis]|uniref:helix-turn-helix transcriptional regulator n=1 Tax=Deinococcus aquaedulcis TaxID=2840455 RepID=UPI001C837149|nr:WYL domain-containing protein [Deinococcus aquaedulcis]
MDLETLGQAQRLFLLAALLRARPMTIKQLVLHFAPDLCLDSKEWRRAERMVQRDVKALVDLGEKVVPSKTRPPRYHIEHAHQALTPTELLIFHAALRLTYHRAAGEGEAHKRAMQRIIGWLPEHLRDVTTRSLGDMGKRRRTPEDLNLRHAADAWTGGHPLRFLYKKPGGSGQLRPNIIEPYLIEPHPQNLDLYVIGRETTFHNAVRTFKLARMQQPEVLRGEQYRIPADFQPREFLESAWGIVGAQGGRKDTIHLRFRADARYRIEEGGYPHLKHARDPNPDGSLNATLQAPPDSSGLPREALAWIFSFGPRVKVLGPPHIREYWLNELREAAGQGGERA